MNWTKYKPTMLKMALILFFMWRLDVIFSLDIYDAMSDFQFVLLQIVAEVMIALLSIWILWKYGNREIFRFHFKGSYIGYLIWFLFLHLVWSVICYNIFPMPVNQSGWNQDLASASPALLMLYQVSIILIIPIAEELIFRGVAMDVLAPLKKYHLDLILSSALFSLLHLPLENLVLADFITYFVFGLIMGTYFKKTGSIYYAIAYHIFWNSIPFLIRFLT